MRPLNPPKGDFVPFFMPTFRLGRNECMQQYKSSNKGAHPKGRTSSLFFLLFAWQRRMHAAIQIKQQRSAPKRRTSSLLCLLFAWAETNACSNTNQATKERPRRGGIRPVYSHFSLGQKRMHAAIQIKQQMSAPRRGQGGDRKAPLLFPYFASAAFFSCRYFSFSFSSFEKARAHTPIITMKRIGMMA